MATNRKPAAPRDLDTRGRGFWRDVVKVYELNVDEMQVLAEVCRTLDDCDRLRERIEADGHTVRGSTGQVRLHPALAELRQTRLALAKFLAQLGLPDVVDGSEALPAPASRRGTKAATARWKQADLRLQRRQETARHGTNP